MQMRAIPSSDCPLRDRALGETAKDLQRRILIGQKNIPPHGWIGPAIRVKSRKPAAEYLITSLSVTA